MTLQSTEDRLRAEYFQILPTLRRVQNHLETEIRYALLPLSGSVATHERVVVTSRIKDCESAIEKLRRKEQGRRFNPDLMSTYRLRNLKDLVGVKVLAFPSALRVRADSALRQTFPDWTPDPFREGSDLGFKYVGRSSVDDTISAEYQILPTLVGMFWDVEHTAIYKPDPTLASSDRDIMALKTKSSHAIRALIDFEDSVEQSIQAGPDSLARPI